MCGVLIRNNYRNMFNDVQLEIFDFLLHPYTHAHTHTHHNTTIQKIKGKVSWTSNSRNATYRKTGREGAVTVEPAAV